MAEIVRQEAPPGASEEPTLAARPRVRVRRAVRTGIGGGLTAVFVSAIGMVQAFSTRALISELSLGYAFLGLIALVVGYAAARPERALGGYEAERPGWRNVAAGAIAGAVAAVLLSAFVVLVTNVNIRGMFTNVSPQMVELLTFGRSTGGGVLLLAVFSTGLAVVGTLIHLVPQRWRSSLLAAIGWILLLAMLQRMVSQVIAGIGNLVPRVTFEPLNDFLYTPRGALTLPGLALIGVLVFAVYLYLRRAGHKGVRARLAELPEPRRRATTAVMLLVIIAVLFVLPQVVGSQISHVLNFAGIFLVMALGLNVVVGFAGLLDLGYVAFFAVGAYATAVLTSPISPTFAPELTFIVALPFVMLAAALSGIIVGTPVLRMRGDYLAIVTLGFGEIVRILVQSDWLKPFFGGARGVRQTPSITVPFTGLELSGPQLLFYAVLFFAVVAAYISYALHDSRIGRAWMAMREDESVAEAMGVNIVSAKLWAFVIGAVIASFGGALFATQVHSVFPSSFEVIVSITVLVVVIVGGIESIPGVMVGALVLIGLPQLLREFEAYRFLIYGALLIFMMLKRPEGFIPSTRRARELHEQEILQDAWLKAEAEREEEEERRRAATPAS